MGIGRWIIKHSPGGPKSVAKTMHRAFLQGKNSGMTRDSALRFSISSRYMINRIADQKTIDSFIEESDSLATLVFLCVGLENRAACEFPFMESTVEDIHEFFLDNDPSEIGSFSQLLEIVKTGKKLR